jgi:hypothetical protein
MVPLASVLSLLPKLRATRREVPPKLIATSFVRVADNSGSGRDKMASIFSSLVPLQWLFHNPKANDVV